MPGQPQVMTLYDSGSTQTSIDYDDFRRMYPNRRLEPSRTRLAAYDVRGSVSLPVTVAGVTWMQTFNVIKNNPRSLVFGLDTMLKRRIKLDPAGNHPIQMSTTSAEGTKTVNITPAVK